MNQLRWVTAATLALVLAATLGSCKEDPVGGETAIVVQIDADAAVKAATAHLHVLVYRQADGQWQERADHTSAVVPGDFPLSFPIVPAQDGADPAIEVQVEALDAQMRTVLQSRLVTRFVTGQVSTVPMYLIGDCLGDAIDCGADSSCHGADCSVCRGGQCETTGIVSALPYEGDQSIVELYERALEGLMGTAPVDASTADADTMDAAPTAGDGDGDACDPDPCNGNGTCDPGDGSCTCGGPNMNSDCSACLGGFIGYPSCTDDLCDPDPCNGNGTCDPGDGSCTCGGPNMNSNCSACLGGFIGYPSCSDDLCDPDPCNGNGSCDSGNGMCTCSNPNMNSDCSACLGGFIGYPSCSDDLCDPDPCNGNGTCDPGDGSCTCGGPNMNVDCSACSPGFIGYPNCVDDLCDPDPCSGNGTCDPGDGSCTCNDVNMNVDCSACLGGFIGYPNCVDDPCDPDPCNGNGSCDSGNGMCTCSNPNMNVDCSACSPGFIGYPNCVDDLCDPDPCNGNGSCDPGDGSCSCADGFGGAGCDSCDVGFDGYPSCAAPLYVEGFFAVGDSQGDYFGFDGAISVGGDTNGDGVGDVLVGAAGMNIFGSYTGGAYLLSGADGSLLHFFNGEEGSANFGDEVSIGPDATGDGLADLLISAHTHDGGFDTAGRVYLYNGDTGAIVRFWTGTRDWELLGRAISLGPDVDNDGLADVLASSNNDGSPDQVLLYSSGTGNLLRTFTGATDGDSYGGDLELVADVSGDGRGDVLISARNADIGLDVDIGEVYLYSGLTGATLDSWQGTQAGDRFGQRISAGSDADGDGDVDFLIGAPSADRGGVDNIGEVQLFSSSDGSLLRTYLGSQKNDYLGTSLSLGGDIDGDNLGDVLLGSNNERAAVYSSASGQLLHLWSSGEPSFGGSVSMAKDGGSGLPMVAIATPSYNSSQGAITLQHENTGPVRAECTGRCGGASDGIGGTCTGCGGGEVCSEQICIPDPCSPDPCNGNGTCTLGTCGCDPEYAGDACDGCNVGYLGYPACTPSCSVIGPIDDVTAMPGAYPRLAWSGSNYGMSWRVTGGPQVTQMTELTQGGVAGTDNALAGEFGYQTDIAWDSDNSRFGVAWSTDKDVGFVCMAPGGTQFGSILKLANGVDWADDGIGVAYYPAVGRYAVVWSDASSGTYQVYVAMIRSSNCTVATSAVQVSAAYANAPDVAFGSASFGIIWRNSDGDMFFRRVNSSGGALSSITQIGSSSSYVDSGGGPQIIGDGSGFAAVWAARDPVDLVAFAQIDINGTVTNGPITLADTSDYVSGAMLPSITKLGSNFGVAFRGGSQMRFMELDSAGVRISPVIDFHPSGYWGEIANDGSDYLVVSGEGNGNEIQSYGFSCQ